LQVPDDIACEFVLGDYGKLGLKEVSGPSVTRECGTEVNGELLLVFNGSDVVSLCAFRGCPFRLQVPDEIVCEFVLGDYGKLGLKEVSGPSVTMECGTEVNGELLLVFNGSDVVSLCAFNRIVLSVP